MKVLTSLVLGLSAIAFAQDATHTAVLTSEPEPLQPVAAEQPISTTAIEAETAAPHSGNESTVTTTTTDTPTTTTSSTQGKVGGLVKHVEFSDATAGKLTDLTFTLNPIVFSAPKDGYLNLFMSTAFSGVEDANHKVTCKYSLNNINPGKANGDVTTLYLPGTSQHPAEVRVTLKGDLKAAEADVLRVFCANFPMPPHSIQATNDASFILSDKPYSSDVNAELPSVDRLVEGIAVDKVYSTEEGGAPHPVTIFAISAQGNKPLTQQEVESVRSAVVSATGLSKDDVEFAQTTVLKSDDGTEVVMTLFLIKSKDHSREDLYKLMSVEGTKTQQLQSALSKSLPAYKDLRQTFAQEYISGTCFNGKKDALDADAEKHETDVDCGGIATGCMPCDANKICAVDGDCKSGRCLNNKCTGLVTKSNTASIAVVSTFAVGIVALALSLIHI